MNICNKPSNGNDIGYFKKSIMLQNRHVHGFEILNHVIMLMAWFFMIFIRVKKCKIFKK